VDPLAAARRFLRGLTMAGVEDGGRSLAGGHGARSIDCWENATDSRGEEAMEEL
jgi:hypothetical protein